MRRADLLNLTQWDVYKFKNLARRIGNEKKSQLPFQLRDVADEEEGPEWSDYTPFHAFLCALSDRLVIDAGMGRSSAASFLQGWSYQADIRLRWKKFTGSEFDYYAGQAFEADDPKQPSDLRIIPIFAPFDQIKLPNRTGRSVTLANASQVWRVICERAKHHEIDISNVFGEANQ